VVLALVSTILEIVILLHCFELRYNFDLWLINTDTLMCRCGATIGLVKCVELCFPDDDEFHWGITGMGNRY
jgi:hypothetical protein